MSLSADNAAPGSSDEIFECAGPGQGRIQEHTAVTEYQYQGQDQDQGQVQAGEAGQNPDRESGVEAVDVGANMAEQKDNRAPSDEGPSVQQAVKGHGKPASNVKDPLRPRRKKARRACFACQRAHLTCG